MHYQFISDHGTSELDKRRLKAISLADCSNAYATVSAIAVNSTDRSMCILLAYISDNTMNMCFHSRMQYLTYQISLLKTTAVD